MTDDLTALPSDLPSLIRELADTHHNLALLHREIAFLRTQEPTDPSAKTQRILREGDRDAYTEKKWLIMALLNNRVD